MNAVRIMIFFVEENTNLGGRRCVTIVRTVREVQGILTFRKGRAIEDSYSSVLAKDTHLSSKKRGNHKPA